jgi:hypothetical protein
MEDLYIMRKEDSKIKGNRKEGNKIKDSLWSKGYTIQGLSVEMGISAITLHKKLAGSIEFKIKEINFLCDKLNMPYEDLFRKQSKKIS